MYSEFYSLNGMPFQLTPDSRFFFGSTEHNKAMAFLNYGISQGEGFVVVTGEVVSDNVNPTLVPREAEPKKKKSA